MYVMKFLSIREVDGFYYIGVLRFFYMVVFCLGNKGYIKNKGEREGG